MEHSCDESRRAPARQRWRIIAAEAAKGKTHRHCLSRKAEKWFGARLERAQFFMPAVSKAERIVAAKHAPTGSLGLDPAVGCGSPTRTCANKNLQHFPVILVR
jgi:hypothetical protein